MSDDFIANPDELQEIVSDFLIEADELVGSLDTNLVKLESASDDLDLLNEIFRAAHTIKGTSSFLGFDQVSGLTHRMEDVLNRLRKAEMSVTPEIMDLLLESLDILKDLLQRVRDGDSGPVNLDAITARLVDALNQEGNRVASVELEPPKSAAGAVAESVTAAVTAASATAEAPNAAATTAAPRTTARKPGGEQTIRVDINRLDSLMNLMGELVLGRNSLVQSVNRMTSECDQNEPIDAVNRSTASISYITTELQLAVMKMRMQPIGKVFSRFPRLVRDLSRDTGKQIELRLFGEETELDKSVIEEIGDPLVHIIRNSCDHGIEPPEERKAKGKLPGGVVTLSASQEGSNIVIKITDDGRGLNADAIRAKAVERTLASRAEIDRMPDKDVFRFIFEAGLSTAAKLTGISGRGVGMDVVRTNIEKLNGMIELDSALDVGTTITVKLPLTLAIIQGLLVETDGDVYILPLSSVIETVKTSGEEIYYVNQRPVLRLRDEVIPVISLTDALQSTGRVFTMAEKPYVVVVGLADQKLGISIDRFLGQEEVVIKSLGQYLGSTEGVAGATILGDGRIRLIVDLLGLFNLARRAT